MSKIVLERKKVKNIFGGLVALNGVNFFIKEEEIVGLIGPNISGKITMFDCIKR